MSADNWATCPRCVKAFAAKKLKMHEDAAKAYGKVPPEEWRRMVTAAEELEPGEYEESSLREDYSFHMTEDGEFFASYRCSCRHCEFSFTFKHTEKVPVEGGK